MTPGGRAPRIRGLLWGGSSAGRASRSQCEGREFDPPPLHQFKAALLLVLCSVLLPGNAVAAESAGVLRIGTTGDYAPYSWWDPGLSVYLGSDIALARQIAASLGLRAEFVRTTWSALSSDAAAGRFDIALGGISVTAERMQQAGFSTAYQSDRKQPVVRCGEEAHFDSVQEISRPQTRLIVNPGGTNERFARAMFPDASLILHEDNRSVFGEILAGRADVMVTDAVEGNLQQRQGKGLCVAHVAEVWAPADKAVWVPAGEPLRAAVNGVLARLAASGGHERTLESWQSWHWLNPADPVQRMAVLVDERLALAVEVARSKWNSGAAIADPQREQQLLRTLRASGAAVGVPEARVERFFRAQIEAAKQLQEDLFAQWRQEQRARFDTVKDLASELRPAIDAINTDMLNELTHLRHVVPAKLASTISGISARSVVTARAGTVPEGN